VTKPNANTSTDRACQTGSGTFTVRDLPTPTPTRSTVTVEVYESYCPGDASALPFGFARIAGNNSANATSPRNDTDTSRFGKFNYNSTEAIAWKNNTLPISPYLNLTNPHNMTHYNGTGNSTKNVPDNTNNPHCRQCPNSAGICCPPGAECDGLGKCPWAAIDGAGYLRAGMNMVVMRNLSDGSQGPEVGMSPEAAGLGRLGAGDVMPAMAGNSSSRAMRLGVASGSSSGNGTSGLLHLDAGSVLAEAERKAGAERAAKELKAIMDGFAPHDFVVVEDG
jgi:hypothetical protein